jgi:hypothetical protein
MNFIHFIFRKTFDHLRMLHLQFPAFIHFFKGFATHLMILNEVDTDFQKKFMIYFNPKLFLFDSHLLFINYFD